MSEMRDLAEELFGFSPCLHCTRFRKENRCTIYTAIPSDIFGGDVPCDRFEDVDVETYLDEEERGGFEIREGKELVSIFTKPGEYIGHQLVDMAIESGALEVDCFGPAMADIYQSHGFKIIEELEWDDRYAPAEWDYEKFGKPKIYKMELKK